MNCEGGPELYGRTLHGATIRSVHAFSLSLRLFASSSCRLAQTLTSFSFFYSGRSFSGWSCLVGELRRSFNRRQLGSRTRGISFYDVVLLDLYQLHLMVLRCIPLRSLLWPDERATRAKQRFQRGRSDEGASSDAFRSSFSSLIFLSDVHDPTYLI